MVNGMPEMIVVVQTRVRTDGVALIPIGLKQKTKPRHFQPIRSFGNAIFTF